MIKMLKEQLNTSALVLIPIAVGINLVGNFAASTLKLPVFLDLIGTTIAGVLGGWLVAVAVAVFSAVFQGMFVNPIYFPFMVVGIVNALIIGFCAKKGWFDDIPHSLIPWALLVIASTITASFVSIIVFGGITGATGASVLTATFMAATDSIIKSVLSSTLIIESIDKLIAVLVAVVVIKKLPNSLRNLNTRVVDDF